MRTEDVARKAGLFRDSPLGNLLRPLFLFLMQPAPSNYCSVWQITFCSERPPCRSDHGGTPRRAFPTGNDLSALLIPNIVKNFTKLFAA
jgi:hypothetical protein